MRYRALVFAVPLALLAVACGSSSSSTTTGSTTASTQRAKTSLATQRAPGVGAVLTTGAGHTVYVFTPEKGGKISCTGTCASTWPVVPARGTPTGTSAVHPNLIGTVANPAGGSVISYAGWPLHTYAPDTGRGSYKGQGVGGQWYMISPSGSVTKKPVSSSSGSSSPY